MTKEKRGERARVTYEAHLKCCTFEPRLPNYLVGKLLATSSSSAKEPVSGAAESGTSSGASASTSAGSRFPAEAGSDAQVIGDGLRPKVPSALLSEGLRKKFESELSCLPLAVLPDLEYTKKFSKRRRTDFGNREDLLCSYYDKTTQNCSIWRYRGAVCTSFFCMSDLGAQGLRFWRLLGEFLHHVEMALSEEALVHLDFSPRQVSEQLEYLEPSGEVRGPNKARWRVLWNSYADPVEFYRKTSQFVENLTREQFEEALGPTGLRKERKLLSQIRRIQLSRLQVAPTGASSSPKAGQSVKEGKTVASSRAGSIQRQLRQSTPARQSAPSRARHKDQNGSRKN